MGEKVEKILLTQGIFLKFQVKSGMLVAPGIPMPLELQEMQEIVGTFGM